MNGHFGVCRMLIDHGIDIDAREARGWTPLYSAALKQLDVCRLLLEHKADVNLADTYGRSESPLMRAATQGNFEICLLLLENGALVNHQYNGGWSALHLPSDARPKRGTMPGPLARSCARQRHATP